MKRSILNLSIALIAITNVAFANGNEDHTFKNPKFTEETVMCPQHLPTVHSKTIDEVIDENNRITESEFVEEKDAIVSNSIEDTIAEDSKIIESDFEDVVYPLDFSRINRKPVVSIVQPKPILVSQL